MIVYAPAINLLPGPNTSVDGIFANSIIVYPINTARVHAHKNSPLHSCQYNASAKQLRDIVVQVTTIVV